MNQPTASASPAPAKPVRWWRRKSAGVVSGAIILAVGWFVVYPFWQSEQLLRRGKASLDDFELGEARDQFDRLVAARPDYPEGHYLRARVARMMEDYPHYFDALDRAKELGWPEEAMEIERLLRQSQQQGPTGEIEKRIHLYINGSHPEDRILLHGLIRGYFNAHQLSDGLRWLNLWVSRYPDDWFPRLWRGDVRVALKSVPEAIEDYRFVLQKKPNHPTVQGKLGAVYLGTKKNDAEAREAFQTQLKLTPNDVESLTGMATLAWNQGNRSEALDSLQKALSLQPNHIPALCLKAKMIQETDPKEALELLRRAEKRNPTELQTIMQLAELLALQNQTTEAESYREKQKLIATEQEKMDRLVDSITREPRNADLRYQLGQSLEKIGRHDEAINWYQTALQIDPGHLPTLEAMAIYFEKRANQPHLARQYRLAIEQLKKSKK
jgi:tetratricopeptide (TPR) repeat protein